MSLETFEKDGQIFYVANEVGTLGALLLAQQGIEAKPLYQTSVNGR